MKKLKSLEYDAAGTGCVAWFAAVGGLLLLFGWGLYGVATSTGTEAAWGDQAVFVVVGVAAALFGLLSIGAGIRLWYSWTRFGKSEVAVNAEILHPGDSFDFSFRQECNRDVDVRAIHIYFVFREHVSYRDDEDTSRTAELDRLIEQVTLPGRKFSSMWPVIFQHKFHIPRRHIYRRNSLMHHQDARDESLYIIKVHLDTGEPDNFFADCLWKSFQVDVTTDPKAPPYPNGQCPEGIFFDLILEDAEISKRVEGWEKVFKDVLPFVRETKIGDVLLATPCVLMERVPLEEAESAQRRLEAAGFRARYVLTEANG